MSGARVAVVGSGPNGLAAAVALARLGHAVVVHEAMPEPGGGLRTVGGLEAGVVHDACATVHAMACISPFLRSLPLHEHGLQWAQPDAPLAHPFDDGTAAVLERSTAATGATLDAADRQAWGRLFDPLVARWQDVAVDVLAPPVHVPRHPRALAAFARRAVRSATGLASAAFAGERARALFAGIAGHTVEPLDRVPTAAFALLLGIAGHAVGWPFARGGSQRLAEALAAELRRHGGEVVTGRRVDALGELDDAAVVLLDLTPKELLRVGGDRLPPRWRRRLARWRWGPGVCKVDWVLREPIPWRARECRRAGTVHVGGGMAEIAAASRDAWAGRDPASPFVILTQPSCFDPTRAPPHRHVAWGYAHVPFDSPTDFTAAIEAQVERFAPGFRELVVARATRVAARYESFNANLVGGSITGGELDPWQLLFRPTALAPYATALPRVFACSAATPPGGGVHGMCGWHAARAAARRLGDRLPFTPE